MAYDPSFEWTGGGYATTAAGLVRWAKLLYEGDAMPCPGYVDTLLGSRAHNRELVEAMGVDFFEYGLGVQIWPTEAGEIYGHGGSMIGYVARMRYFPKRKIAVAMQINQAGYRPLVPHLQHLVDVLFRALDGSA
jgi:D-alanyl-D-alanine carboxypeptidase